MAVRFITQKEHDLVDDINKEFIQGVVGQELIYYAMSLEESEVHDVYNEAVRKVWYRPIRLNARVRYDSPGTNSSGPTLDTKYDIEAFCHALEMEERGIRPREGDFIEFGQVVFEVTSATQPQLVFGQPNHRLMWRLAGTPSREGQFKVASFRAEGVDNTVPVLNRPSTRLEGS